MVVTPTFPPTVDHVTGEEQGSSGTSTEGETELVETMATINFGELKGGIELQLDLHQSDIF